MWTSSTSVAVRATTGCGNSTKSGHGAVERGRSGAERADRSGAKCGLEGTTVVEEGWPPTRPDEQTRMAVTAEVGTDATAGGLVGGGQAKWLVGSPRRARGVVPPAGAEVVGALVP